MIKKVNFFDRIGDKMAYQVKIDVFEGPLDLLLYLIKKMEIDIYDIPMAEITEQYLLYVRAMSELKLDRASEYLVMSATLLSIKSKMLLPKQQLELEDHIEEEEDPRGELVERLIEYRQYKEAALLFQEKEFERGLIYTKPPMNLTEYVGDEQVKVHQEGASIYDMLAAYQQLLKRKRLKKPLQTTVTKRKMTIEQRMNELLSILLKSKKKKRFSSFFPSYNKQHIVVTFLAMLELLRCDAVEAEQAYPFDEIFLSAREERDIS